VGKGESEDIIEDIRALIDKYLQNKRCVVLAIIPANVDFHNSQIMADARIVDPLTERTIPVITKPDLIDEGAEEGVLDLLLGKKTQEFALGFHIVKCRGQKDLNAGMTIAEGIEKEVRYFLTKKPWSQVDNRSLFGVTALGQKLVALEIEMLKKDIPVICKEIAKERQEAQGELSKLGKDLTSEVNRRSVFDNKVKCILREMNGSLSKRGMGSYQDQRGYRLRPIIEEQYNSFCSSILTSRLATYGNLRVGQEIYFFDENNQVCEGVVATTFLGCFHLANLERTK
jgi:hypothetical protein